MKNKKESGLLLSFSEITTGKVLILNFWVFSLFGFMVRQDDAPLFNEVFMTNLYSKILKVLKSKSNNDEILSDMVVFW